MEDEPKFEMDAVTKKRIEEVEKEANQGGENDLLSKVVKECQEFNDFQREVEEQSEAERKRAIEEIAEKAKRDEERFQAELLEIKNYQITEDSNPQQDEETIEDAETKKVREKMMEEIQRAGEEQVKLIEDRMSKYAELDKKLAELAAGTSTKQIEEDTKETEDQADPEKYANLDDSLEEQEEDQIV